VLLSARTEVVPAVAAEFPRDRPSLELNLVADPNLYLCPLFQLSDCHKKTQLRPRTKQLLIKSNAIEAGIINYFPSFKNL